MRKVLSAAAVLAAAAAAGCGGGEEEARTASASASAAGTRSQEAPAEAVGIDRAGSVAQFADCGDWRRATRAQRFATIADIRGQHTPQRSRTAASPLPDERAYEVFQEACKPPWAESLRLYKLYVKVQGFAPLTE